VSAATFRRSGIYRNRWQWWFPWSVTDWWKPRVFQGGDEWCNDAVCFVLPPLGCLVQFWRPGRLRKMPCCVEWGWLGDEERADYAPCGRLHGGRWRDGGHAHWETGICEEAAEWLKTAVPA
jgi:hypothetical protein